MEGLGSSLKKDEIKTGMDSINCDIMAVTEHHKPRSELLDPDQMYSPVLNTVNMKIKSYSSASTHRAKNKGGGVALYWKTGINAVIWEGAPLVMNSKKLVLIAYG